jgi:hypothetical protein
MKFESRFALFEHVRIDSDTSIRGIVSAILFRSYREPLYEVSWINQGQNQVCWIEEPRLEKFES